MRRRKRLNPNTTDTVIGEGTVIKGELSTKGGLRIDGTVDGSIECAGDVTVGKTGKLLSCVMARNIFNAGMIQGSAITKGTLTITDCGVMVGDITVGSLSIAPGGVFEGSSKMEGKASEQAANVKALHEPDKQAEAKIHKIDKAVAGK